MIVVEGETRKFDSYRHFFNFVRPPAVFKLQFPLSIFSILHYYVQSFVVKLSEKPTECSHPRIEESGPGKGNLVPLSGPVLTKTRGLYSSSFSINAEFSKRLSIAAFP